MTRLLSAFFVLAVSAPCVAVTKQIDARNASTADVSAYYIVFCARAGNRVGHAFVAWGVEDNERAVSRQVAYGFYPEEGRGVFGSVPGEIRNEAFNDKTALLTDRLIVRVTKEQYGTALAVYPRWETTEYRLFTTNCVAFTADVARTLGLRVPKNTSMTFPSEFITRLVEVN
jgi:hypothetical protein